MRTNRSSAFLSIFPLFFLCLLGLGIASCEKKGGGGGAAPEEALSVEDTEELTVGSETTTETADDSPTIAFKNPYSRIDARVTDCKGATDIGVILQDQEPNPEAFVPCFEGAKLELAFEGGDDGERAFFVAFKKEEQVIVGSENYLTLDRTAPDVRLTSSLPGITSVAEQTFTWELTEEGAKARYALLFDVSDCSSASFGADLVAGTEIVIKTDEPGDYTLCVKGVDEARNHSASNENNTHTWTYDLNAPKINLFTLMNSNDDNEKVSTSYALKIAADVEANLKYCVKLGTDQPALDDACWKDSVDGAVTTSFSREKVSLWVKDSANNLGSMLDQISVIPTFAGVTSVSSTFRRTIEVNWNACSDCNAEHSIQVFLSKKLPVDTKAGPTVTLEDETKTSHVISGLDNNSPFHVVVKVSDGFEQDANTVKISTATLPAFQGEAVVGPITHMYGPDTSDEDSESDVLKVKTTGVAGHVGLRPLINEGSWNFTNLGIRFKTLTDGEITHGGFWRATVDASNSPDDDNPVSLKLWSLEDKVLYEKTISNHYKGWNYHQFDKSLRLKGNTEYVFAMSSPVKAGNSAASVVPYKNEYYYSGDSGTPAKSFVGTYVRTGIDESTAIRTGGSDDTGDPIVGLTAGVTDVRPQNAYNNHEVFRDIWFSPRVPATDAVDDIYVAVGDHTDRVVDGKTYKKDNFLVEGGEVYRVKWDLGSNDFENAEGEQITETDEKMLSTHIRNCFEKKNVNYQFPVANGTYKVTVGSLAVTSSTGDIVFDIHAEGNLEIDDFDPRTVPRKRIREAAITEVEVDDGVLDLEFIPQNEKTCQMSYIEIETQYKATKTGSGQSGTSGEALTNPFTVKVTQRDGSTAVADVPVVFNLLKGDGSLSAVKVMTDANGEASTVLTVGTASIEHAVVAEVPGTGYLVFKTTP